MANQKGGLPFTIFKPRYGPNVCLLLNHKETFQSHRYFFFFSQKAGLCDLRFFLCRTIEKLGRTLEPC